ncbi:MAG: S1C family serine protease [Vicinamibacterales bacterium]
MTNDFSAALSNSLADAVERVAAGVVQVQGKRRPASGLVFGDDVVVTTIRALGREDGLRVRRHDGDTLEAQLAGWDQTTTLAVLRVPGLGVQPVAVATQPARVGHLALAIARSWSNSVTASAGIVSVIAGPLPTGRRRAIEQVIRTTAPMHDGFAGGALVDVSGGLLGVATAAAIRGLGVVIPTSIAWATATQLLEHGGLKRGYLGLAGQPVRLSPSQQALAGTGEGVLVAAVTEGGPSAAGLLVGDILIEFNGHAVGSPEKLLDLLADTPAGGQATSRVVRGTALVDVQLAVGERPA